MVRLQKFLAEAGVASRRASEQFILDGRVSVNGQVVQTLGTKVDPSRDQISVDGAPIRVKRKLYVALNKPPGYLCSRSQESKRPLIGELLPKEWGNLFTVGRLDLDSEGLIFLTNDGDFSLRLSHPRYLTTKIYHVLVEGKVHPTVTERLLTGVEDAGDLLVAQKATILSTSNKKSLVEVQLTEGKNREVRRMFESQGHPVMRLIRVQVGPIKLGELKMGRWRTLTEPEIKSLLSTKS